MHHSKTNWDDYEKGLIMTTTTVQLIAEKRSTTGTGSSRAARKADKIPAVIYGKGVTPVHIAINAKEINVALSKKGFKKTVFEFEIEGKKLKTVARDIQFHPVTDRPAHLDLILVTEKTSVKVFVPVEYTNHLKSPGLKRGGVLNIVKREVEILANPTNIPEKIEVDLTGIEIGTAIHINDVKLGDGARAVEKRNFTLATVVGKQADEAESVPTAEAAAVAAAAGAPAAAGAAAKAPAAAAAKAPAAKK